VSFFDDEPDEPTRVTRPTRPRRTSGAGRTPPSDPDIARRRLIAAGILAILAIIIIFAVRSCASTRHQNALKDYNRDVTTIVESSDGQVSRQLFDVLSNGGNPNDVQVAVNQVRQQADENARRAKQLDAPGDMDAAQRNLELVMNLRDEGVRGIADNLPKALTSGRAAVSAMQKVVGQMQAFLASDVVYSQRVAPLIRNALDDADIHGTRVAASTFLPSLGWLDYTKAAERINADAGGAGSTATGEPKPGTHGHGLVSVSAGGVTLQPGDTPNRVPVSAGLAFDVTFQNQGENDESNVKVTVKIAGQSKTIDQSKTIRETKAGQTASVTVQVADTPPKGSVAKVTVTVGKVPGEQTLDNNTQTYSVLFT
jgi:hypothetical protein